MEASSARRARSASPARSRQSGESDPVEEITPSARYAHATALVGCLALLGCFAWLNRNLVDDAFIGFRYAEHFANGQGLVWNPGERVEGFTSSFLWVVLLGLFLKAGFEPIAITFALNISFLLAALTLFYFVARRVLGSPWHALAAVVILGTNFTFSSSGTLGIGTQLQTVFLLASLLALMSFADTPQHRPGAILTAVSWLAALAVLVRIDSLLPVGFLFLAALVHLLQSPAISRSRLSCLVALFLPGGVLIGGWAVWKWHYYGTVLPNTFWIKVPGTEATWAGLYYVYAFLLSYLLFAQLPVVVIALRDWRWRSDWVIGLACAIVISWFGYVARIGGDFIEFRFLACIIPFVILTIYWSVLRVTSSVALRVGLLALIVLGSIHHWLAFGRSIFANCVYRPSLAILSVPPPTASSPMLWSELETGQFLGRAFEHDPNVRIAVGAAGVIPYYSKLWVLDILGLSDPWIAQNGLPLHFDRFIGGFYPGHVRIAPVSHLVQRGVNLFLGVGVLTRDDYVSAVRSVPDLLAAMFLEDQGILAVQMQAKKSDFPSTAKVVEIPVRPGYKMLGIYLTPSERVDAVIAANAWRTYSLHDLEG